MTGVNMVHVPYRGGGPALTDLLAGQVQVFFPPMVVAVGQVRAGKLRALAVTTATRSEALPDIPTVGEFVPGYEASVWFGLGAPKGTPAGVIDKLNQETNAAAMTPYHVARSKLFVRERFGKVALSHLDTMEIEANIEHTQFPVPKDEQHTATDDF